MTEKLLYTEEELPQRGEKWLELRKSTIGASETGAILGLLTKYEKPITVWKRKTGKLKPKETNYAMLRGQRMEEEARNTIKRHLEDIEFVKNPQITPYFGLHSKHNYISASFDGVDLINGFITEIKCPGYVGNFKSVFEDGIQDYYYCQVQQQLLIAKDRWNIEKAYFCSYYPDGAYILSYDEFKEYLKTLAVIDIEYDEPYCNAMLKVLRKFQDNVTYDKWDADEYQEVLDTFYAETKFTV